MPSNNTPSQHHYNKSLHRREFDVFSPDGLVCYTVPAGRIAHFGDESKRMMVCRNYASGGTCPMGNHCKFVHIDVALNTLRSGAIHTHYVWRDPSVVTYDRLAPFMAKNRTDVSETEVSDLKLTVFGPNNRAPAEQVRAGDLLLTVGGERAFAIAMGEREIDTTKTSPHPCHCAHYYFNQVCNRGAGCGFVHVISLNPKQAEAKVRHSNFHKRLEAIGCQYTPAHGDTPDELDETDENRGGNAPRRGSNGRNSDARPIRIPKGATIRPASPVARNGSAQGSRRSSRAVSVSLEKKKSAAVSFEDITAITGQAESLDADNHPPIWIPSVHVGALPAPSSAPQQGPLSVVVGVRSQTPSHNASSTLLQPPTNGGHERRASLVHSRRPSEHESLMHSCNSFGHFPARIPPLPPLSSSANQQSNQLLNGANANDPLSFASQTQFDNFATNRVGGGQLSAEDLGQQCDQPLMHQPQQHPHDYIATNSANVSRRPSNVMDSSNRLNVTNIGGASFNNGAQSFEPDQQQTNTSANFNEDDSFNRNAGGRGHTRFASNGAANPNNLFTVAVASAAASTNNSFAYNNGQVPYVPSQNPNAYTLSIGDLRQQPPQPQWKTSTDDLGSASAATGKTYFDNGFDVNLLQQKQQGPADDQQPQFAGFDSAPQSFSQDVQFMSNQRSGSQQQAPPTPQSSSHFPSPQHNYTTETMRMSNLHHMRNAVNASEGGNSSNAYNFSNSNNFNSSNPQRGHARQGSQGLDYATPSKVTTSPGRYAHNPYGGGNASSQIALSGSMLGRQEVEAGETEVQQH